MTSFGLAAPNVPDSYECLPASYTMTIPQAINVTDAAFTQSSVGPVNQMAGIANYVWPVTGGFQWRVAVAGACTALIAHGTVWADVSACVSQ